MRRLFAVAALALLAACDDVPTTPWAEQPPMPDSPAITEHGEARLLLLARDPESGYSLALGLTPDEIAVWCNTGSVATAEQRWRDLAVFLPQGGVKFRDQGREVPAVVYLGDDSFCTDAPIYATGTANVVFNERFGGPGAGGHGYTAIGTVTNGEDEVFRLHLSAHIVFLPNGEVREHGPITLRPLD